MMRSVPPLQSVLDDPFWGKFWHLRGEEGAPSTRSDLPERDLGNLVSCLLTKGMTVRVGNETEDAGRGGCGGLVT